MASRVSPYRVTKTRSPFTSWIASATSHVGNGKNPTPNKTRRLSRNRISVGSSESIRQRSMGKPCPADREKADEVREVVRPRLEHLLQRAARRMRRDVQDEQGGEQWRTHHR